MRDLSSANKESIALTVEDLFDKLALEFIGNIPKLRHKKHLIISTKPNYGLANLFVQSLRNTNPNIFESEALKSILDNSLSYIESLKSKTKADILEGIGALAREASLKGESISGEKVQELLHNSLDKARSHMKTIVDTESTKARNIGKALDIKKVGLSAGDMDPRCYFVITRDNVTCKECIRLHLDEDGVTPRIWKFSELKQGYHIRGEDVPSMLLMHPNCRCGLVYLAPGFGFKDGKLTYIG